MLSMVGFSGPGLAGGGGGPIVSDVVYLAPFTDGTNGDSTYNDKRWGDTLNFFGTAQLSNDIAGPFGEGLTLKKPGNSRVRLGAATTHVPEWDFMLNADTDWCVEFWLYIPAESGLANTIYCWGATDPSPDDVVHLLNYNSTNNALNFATTKSDETVVTTTFDFDVDGLANGIGPNLGIWHHVHMSRTGDDHILGVDGYNKVTAGAFTGLEVRDFVGLGGTQSPTIGASTYNSGSVVADDLPFYMAHFRATANLSYYGTGATYTVPSAAFPIPS